MSQDSDSEDMKPRSLAKHPFGSVVTQLDHDIVLKRGSRTRANEAAAMRLVREHLPSFPVPQVYHFHSDVVDDDTIGQLYMSFVPGDSLDNVWDTLDDTTKDRVSRDIWDLVAQIRIISRPAYPKTEFYSTVDGSPIWDPLLSDNHDVAPPLPNDAALRERIFARYVRCNGLSYADGKDLPDMLPRSNKSIFTHGDIGPRNIMVDKSGQILSLVDWENAGWYPDYWEYASMMKPSSDWDWMAWMDRTKPEPWDITGIKKARRVLF